MTALDLVFFGTPDIAVPTLEALAKAGHRILKVYTQPDRPSGRGRRLTRCPVARCADRLGLDVAQPAQVRQAAGEVRALGGRAGVVVAFGQLLPPDILDAFALGCINLHTSLLPRLRGASPINAAILRGYQKTGATTMFMDQGLDTGDIIYQQSLPIGPQETAGSLFERLAPLGADLMLRTLEDLAGGAAPRTPQDHAQASYAPLFKKSDGLIHWELPAGELDRRVRGLDPWPGAFTSWRGKTLKLFAPTLLDAKDTGNSPGTVIAPRQGRDDLLWVAAGSGALGLGQIQAPGKKRLPAGEYLRGARLEPGQVLGE